MNRSFPFTLVHISDGLALSSIRTSALVFFPAILFSAGVSLVGKCLRADTSAGHSQSQLSVGFSDLLGLTLFAPLVESAVMWALVYGLKHFRFGDNAVVLISASIFSILHATVSLVWLLPSFWAFLLYGSAMIVWSGRSTKLGFFGALLPHALNNAFVFFVAFLDQRYGLS